MRIRRFQHLEMAHHVTNTTRSRILVIWDLQKVQLEIKEWHDQYCHTKIQCKITMKEYVITFLYEQLTIASRERMWDGLQQLVVTVHLPWVILGDFNSP